VLAAGIIICIPVTHSCTYPQQAYQLRIFLSYPICLCSLPLDTWKSLTLTPSSKRLLSPVTDSTVMQQCMYPIHAYMPRVILITLKQCAFTTVHRSTDDPLLFSLHTLPSERCCCTMQQACILCHASLKHTCMSSPAQHHASMPRYRCHQYRQHGIHSLQHAKTCAIDALCNCFE